MGVVAPAALVDNSAPRNLGSSLFKCGVQVQRMALNAVVNSVLMGMILCRLLQKA